MVDKVGDPGIQDVDLLSKYKQYPGDFGITNLSPLQFAALAERISSDEATAVKYYNLMCESPDCLISSCNELCR